MPDIDLKIAEVIAGLIALAILIVPFVIVFCK